MSTLPKPPKPGPTSTSISTSTSTAQPTTTTTTKPSRPRLPPPPPPPGPRPPVSIDPTATLSAKAILTGTHLITLHPHTIIHPFARLLSTSGPIELHHGAVVWEKACIGDNIDDNDSVAPTRDDDKPSTRDDTPPTRETPHKLGPADGTTTTALSTSAGTVILERNVVVEACAVVGAGARVGQGTVVEVGARVGRGAVLGEYCRITPLTVVPAHSTVPAYTVVFGERGEQQRRVNTTLRDDGRVRELHGLGHEKHVGLMQKMVKGSVVKWQ